MKMHVYQPVLAHSQKSHLEPPNEPLLLKFSGSATGERRGRNCDIHEVGGTLPLNRLLEKPKLKPGFQFNRNKPSVPLGGDIARPDFGSNAKTTHLEIILNRRIQLRFVHRGCPAFDSRWTSGISGFPVKG